MRDFCSVFSVLLVLLLSLHRISCTFLIVILFLAVLNISSLRHKWYWKIHIISTSSGQNRSFAPSITSSLWLSINTVNCVKKQIVEFAISEFTFRYSKLGLGCFYYTTTNLVQNIHIS
jgi:hypothetical protein